MGEITRTIVLSIPANIVYKEIKEHFIRKWIRIFCPDLISGAFLQDIIVCYSLSKDIRNSKLVFTGRKFGVKIEDSFAITPIDEEKSEVTLNVKYRFVSDSAARAYFIQIIGCLLMFERGYKCRKM